jgi:hypothetical protein
MSTAKVPLLIVEPVQLTLSFSVLQAVNEELKSGGLVAGMFYIGGITAVPDMLYLLWHLAGEVPVTAMINRDTMAAPDTARTAIQDFLLKWNQRIG